MEPRSALRAKLEFSRAGAQRAFAALCLAFLAGAKLTCPEIAEDAGRAPRITLSYAGGRVSGRSFEYVLTDDYRVHFLLDDQDRIHVIDSVGWAAPNRGYRIDDATEAADTGPRAGGEPIFDVDPQAAKKAICAKRARMPPEGKQREFLEMIANRARAMRIEEICGLSVLGIPAGFFVEHVTIEMSRAGDSRWFVRHGSNFYMTLPLMGAIHYCAGGGSNARRAAFFSGAAANFAEEFNLNGHPIVRTYQGNRTETDWDDLRSGLASVAVYAIWSWWAERGTGQSLAGFCE